MKYLLICLALIAGCTSKTPVTIVVPFAAGGPTDQIAIAFAETARKHGVDVTIKNVGGAGGTVGAAEVAKTLTTDHTTLLLHNVALAAAPSLYPDLPYVTQDFEFVGIFEELPMVLIGRPSLSQDLRTLVKNDKLVLAHAGVGSASYLCGRLLQSALGVHLVEKAYTGNAPAIADMKTGAVDLLCDVVSSAGPHIAAGTVHAYGVTAQARSAALPAVPTLAEIGVSAQMTVWFGLCAPWDTPELTLRGLSTLVKQVATDPDFVKRQEAAGATMVMDKRLSREGHRAFVLDQIQNWRGVLGALK